MGNRPRAVQPRDDRDGVVSVRPPPDLIVTRISKEVVVRAPDVCDATAPGRVQRSRSCSRRCASRRCEKLPAVGIRHETVSLDDGDALRPDPSDTVRESACAELLHGGVSCGTEISHRSRRREAWEGAPSGHAPVSAMYSSEPVMCQATARGALKPLLTNVVS